MMSNDNDTKNIPLIKVVGNLQDAQPEIACQKCPPENVAAESQPPMDVVDKAAAIAQAAARLWMVADIDVRAFAVFEDEFHREYYRLTSERQGDVQ